MIEFGKSLRAAREAKGYTVGQLAELTRLAPRTINELESEDFTHIAAPIYGRGFVKLYCAKVGLDPVPFVSKFMDIYSGNCDVGIRERPTSAATAESAASVPVSEPEQEQTPEPQPKPASESLPEPMPEPQPESSFELQSEPTPAQSFEPQPETVPTPSPTQLDFLAPEPTGDTPQKSRELKAPNVLGNSRYATPVRPIQQTPGLSPSFWRLGILAGAALVLIILAVWGLKALFAPSESESQAESESVPEPAVTQQATAKPEPKTPEAKAPEAATPARTQPRKEQKIPALFID